MWFLNAIFVSKKVLNPDNLVSSGDWGSYIGESGFRISIMACHDFPSPCWPLWHHRHIRIWKRRCARFLTHRHVWRW